MNEASSARPVLMEGRSLTKNFGKVTALRGVSLEIRQGEVLGLVGDNGAGKSTLIKILTGFHRPDSGELLFEGRPVRFQSPQEARRLGIETVYQDLALVETMSVARNFFLGAEPTRRLGFVRLLDHAQMVSTTERLLREIGVRVRSGNEGVRALSGGERQAIAIGRTIHFGARLIILDEPTSALSVHETNKVLGYVDEARRRGLAAIFISHNLHHVHPISDHIVVLQRGEKAGDFQRGQVTLDDLTALVDRGNIEVPSRAGG